MNKKINILINSAAQPGELTINEIETALQANLETANKKNFKAKVIRDFNGKVVAVEVNLGKGVTDNEHSNAAAAITANRGVAIVKMLPEVQLSQNYETADLGSQDLAAPLFAAIEGNYGTEDVPGVVDTASQGGGTKSFKFASTTGVPVQDVYRTIDGLDLEDTEFSLYFKTELPAAPYNANSKFQIGYGGAGLTVQYSAVGGDTKITLATTTGKVVWGYGSHGIWYKFKVTVTGGLVVAELSLEDGTVIWSLSDTPWPTIMGQVGVTSSGAYNPMTAYVDNVELNKI